MCNCLLTALLLCAFLHKRSEFFFLLSLAQSSSLNEKYKNYNISDLHNAISRAWWYGRQASNNKNVKRQSQSNMHLEAKTLLAALSHKNLIWVLRYH